VDDDKSFKSKVKYMWKSYGVIAIGTYFGIYVTTLGSLFFALDFDVFNAVSVGLDPVLAVQKVSTTSFNFIDVLSKHFILLTVGL